jgi:hypothetical protein
MVLGTGTQFQVFGSQLSDVKLNKCTIILTDVDLIREGQTTGACEMHGGKRNAYRVLVGKIEEVTWKTQKWMEV